MVETTRSHRGVATLLVLFSACQPAAPSPRRAAVSSTPNARQPSTPSALRPSTPPLASVTPPPASVPAAALPPRSNCGLATPAPVQLMPVFRERVVVQKSLGQVKLRGTPRLIAEPEDFAEYYLGESAIDPRTLPASLQALSGSQLHVLRGADECKPKLGKISAFAWADEEGPGWSANSPARNAARAFKKGQSFLVAQLEPSCDLFWGGLVTLNPIDGYRAWDKIIDEPDAARGVERRDIFQQALATLPQGGANLPSDYLHFTQASLGEASLLVLELQSGASEPSWLRVWCVETDGSLVPLGPGPAPPELSHAITHYRHWIEFIGRPGSLPIILYSYFGLDPSSGHYTYFNPSIGPAPHI